MAQFPKMRLTKDGKDCLIRSASGKSGDRLIITKLKLGDGDLTEDIYNLHDVIRAKKEVTISGFEDKGNGTAICEFIYDNSNVECGFYHKEIGLFGKNGDSGAEKLISYSNAGSYSSYIPDKNTPIPMQTAKIGIFIGDNEHVEAKFDLSNTLSIEKAKELINASENKIKTDLSKLEKQIQENKQKITADINNHNVNGNAHSDIRSSIYNHKTADTLDHPNNSVKTKHIEDKAITTYKLADLSVTTQKLANKSVTTDKLQDDCVTIDKLANSVTESFNTLIKSQISTIKTSKASLTENGWWKDEGTGLIIQWGVVDVYKNGNNDMPITYPISFSRQCLLLQAQIINKDRNTEGDVEYQVVNVATNKANLFLQWHRSCYGMNGKAYWFALGY